MIFRKNLRNRLSKLSFETTDQRYHWAFELGEMIIIFFDRSWNMENHMVGGRARGTWNMENHMVGPRARGSETMKKANLNEAKNTRNLIDWLIYREAQRLYKNLMKVVKVKR